MTCPSCEYQLQKLSVTTNEGGRFDVDHCGYCGGTWFDPYEINRIPYHEVVRIAKLTVLPRTPVAATNKHLCPRDHIDMVPYKAEAAPSQVKLLWCRKCLGIWATQKALWEFKRHQEQTISEYKVGDKVFPSLSVVFVPVITVLVLMLATFATIINLQKSQEERIQAAVMLKNIEVKQISGTTAVLSFTTISNLVSEILYGPSSLELTTVTISKDPALQHSLLIGNLKPGTVYIYRLILTTPDGRTMHSELKSFTTE